MKDSLRSSDIARELRKDSPEQSAPSSSGNGDGMTAFIQDASVETVSTQAPILLNMADVEAKPVDWLWRGRIAFGTISMILGNPGDGKTFITLDMAARISNGAGWPDSPDTPQERGDVVFVNCEDDLARVVRPRLELVEADLTRIKVIRGVRVEGEERFFSLHDNLPALRTAIAQSDNCRMVVVDPLGAFLGRVDSHKHSEVYRVLGPLADLAEAENVAVVLVQHLNKTLSPSAIGRQMGSTAFSGVARNTFYVIPDDESDRSEDRLFLHGKHNLAPEADGLRFRIESPGVVLWGTESVKLNADQVFARQAATTTSATESAVEAAGDWLQDQLADGPVDSKEIEAGAHAQGISKRTLDRAKKQLGVQSKSVHEDGRIARWMVELPTKASETV